MSKLGYRATRNAETQDKECLFSPHGDEAMALARAIERGLFALYPVSDYQDRMDAAIDAVVFILKNPEKLDPTKGNLFVFGRTIAKRRLVDIWRKRVAENKWITFYGSDDLDSLTNETAHPYEVASHFCDTLTAKHLIRQALADRLERALYIIRQALPDQLERALYIDGVCNPPSARISADLLDITHLPTDEQRVIVRRHHDRLKKKVGRISKLDCPDFVTDGW